MTTMRDLIAETRRMTYGSMSESLNLVAAPAAAGEGEITLELDVSGM